MSVVRWIAAYTFGLAAFSTATAQTSGALPNSVRSAIADMAQECRDVGGVTRKSPNLVVVAELTDDQWQDYVLHHGAFNCEGTASLFSGTGGSEVSVYVGTPDGQAILAFSSGAFGVRLDRVTKPNRLQLLVGGALCGEQIAADRAQSSFNSCWRPVAWNAGNKKMEWAPVSQIQSAE